MGASISLVEITERTTQKEEQYANGGVNSQDFIAERGGNPEKIRESQRKRNANVEIVDEIIADWEDHRKSMAPWRNLFTRTRPRYTYLAGDWYE